jgi:hypothetical protein
LPLEQRLGEFCRRIGWEGDSDTIGEVDGELDLPIGEMRMEASVGIFK